MTELKEWQKLIDHQRGVDNEHMRDWFDKDPERFSRFTLNVGDILFDYSRNRISEETITLLCALAESAGLSEKRAALFNGAAVNTTEGRAALHTALRDQTPHPLHLNGEDIKALIASTRKQMETFAEAIHSKTWRGVTGKPIQHIVNVGIGGSYLGPQMCAYALKDFAISTLQFHFISSVDQSHLNEVLTQIDPETTLFIISSKSFSTLETTTNANTLLQWMRTKLKTPHCTQHFCAVTSAELKALEFGIPKNQIFPLWDWVGGRYSIWSAIGLPLLLMIGPKQFDDFIQGAYLMDTHFKEAPLNENMPVLLALLGIWYMNFFGAQVQAVVPYAERLKFLIPYLQQAEMESNGKRINLNGKPISYATGPVVFGGEGCNGQHAYHQLFHQGQHIIPVDFILVGTTDKNAIGHTHQDILIASALSQAQALMRGKTYEEAYADLIAKQYAEPLARSLAEHQVVPGNRPSNILFLKNLTPTVLGTLIALYEHKIFVQGVIWHINSFDQWGVELGKQLLPDILRCVQGKGPLLETDSGTAGLIHHFKKINGQS